MRSEGNTGLGYTASVHEPRSTVQRWFVGRRTEGSQPVETSAPVDAVGTTGTGNQHRGGSDSQPAPRQETRSASVLPGCPVPFVDAAPLDGLADRPHERDGTPNP